MNGSKNLLINIINIPDSYFFSLNGEFRLRLFQECLKELGSLKILAKHVGYSPERLRSIKNGKCMSHGNKLKKVLISKKLCIQLSEISKISLEEIEKNIIEIRKNHAGLPIPVTLPLKTSASLASVIGNACGDGCLRSNTK